jgi:hypothetical protein
MTSRLAMGVSAALLALGFGGCSSSGADNSMFIGAWQYSSGTSTITCQGQGPVTSQLSGTLTVSTGVSSPLVVVGPTCTLKITPNGSAAVLDPAGQICPPTSGVDANGTAYTETDTYQSGSFTVAGITGTLAESGSALLVGGGASTTCMFTANGTLNKVSK